MDSTRYIEVVGASERKGLTYSLELTPAEVGILHGAIRLMLLHPQVAETFSDSFKFGANRLRTACLKAFADMGFTPDEIEYMDSALDE